MVDERQRQIKDAARKRRLRWEQRPFLQHMTDALHCDLYGSEKPLGRHTRARVCHTWADAMIKATSDPGFFDDYRDRKHN